MTKYALSITLTIGLLLSGCAAAPEKSTDTTTASTATPIINDYPTRDRVEYVLNCIAKHGGLNYVNQYACGCKIDKLAEQMTFKEYDEARTFSMLYSTAGEKGGVFRDPKQSKTLRDRLKTAEAFAEKACFVK